MKEQKTMEAWSISTADEAKNHSNSRTGLSDWHPSKAPLHCCSKQPFKALHLCKSWILRQLWKVVQFHPGLCAHSTYAVPYCLIYYPNGHISLWCYSVQLTFQHNRCIFQSKAFYPSHVTMIHSPLPRHQCIEFQKDNGWYLEECKRLMQRGVHLFLFLQEYVSPAVSTLFSYISYPSSFLKNKSWSGIFLTGWHGLLLIFIWAKLWGNVHVYPKSLSISHYLSFLYIYSIYALFCC